MTASVSLRNEILEYAFRQYGVKPEYLWRTSPGNAVLRRPDNRKWFAVLLRVPRNRLGLSGEEETDILDVKCDPALAGALCAEGKAGGILPGYHMNKNHWITILLDGTVKKERIFPLLEMSRELAGSGAAALLADAPDC